VIDQVDLDERSAKLEMVRDGFAWRYLRTTSRRVMAAEADARKYRRGRWSDKDPVPPRDSPKGETVVEV